MTKYTSIKVLFKQLLPISFLSMSILACGGGEQSAEPGLEFQQKTLTVEVEGNGTVEGDIECSSVCNSVLNQNQTIEIQAIPAQGYIFQQWNGACSGSGTCQVVMNGDKTVAAVFVEENTSVDQFQLSVSNNGFGSITSTPAGINCGTDCTESFDENTSVTMLANPDAGYVFTGWTGSCGGTGQCVVTVNQALSVTANFQQQSVPDIFELTVTVTGQGTVSSSPGGINCGLDCAQDYQSGTTVVLSASPESGYEFVSWGGACTGAASCSVNMNNNQSASAVFQQINAQTYELTTSLVGGGTVSSTPNGINCGTDCSQSFVENTQVVLLASADSGFEFSGWSGACSGNTSCSLSMSSNQNVTATFIEVELVEFALNVTVDGQGSVTSQPSGINCGISCSEMFAENTQVTLSASADTGFEFSGWSGACTGNSSCSVSMDSAQSVTATFIEVVLAEFALNVTVDGQGSVTSQPSGIDCGSDCSQTFEENTSITLTAIADSGFELDHWEGACSGNGACSVTITEVTSVTAVFAVEVVSAVLIENYSQQSDPFQLGQIPNNASGITWHSDLQQYLVVQNNASTVYRYDVNFAYLGQFRVSGISADTEGLAYVNDNQVMIVSEDNYASRMDVDEFTSAVDGDVPNSQRYRVMTRGGSNKGMEGVAVRKASGSTPARIYACQEGTQGSNMRVVYFDMPADSSSLYDYSTNLTVIEPFDADQAFSGSARDLAGMVFDARTNDLIIVSQESRRALQVDPDSGAIRSTLGLSGAPQYEGVTIGPNGELVFVSEGNWIHIFELN